MTRTNGPVPEAPLFHYTQTHFARTPNCFSKTSDGAAGVGNVTASAAFNICEKRQDDYEEGARVVVVVLYLSQLKSV